MGKTSKTTSLNSPAKSVVSINGKSLVETSIDGGNIYSSFSLNPEQEFAYNYAQKSFSENLPSVNVFSNDTINNLNKQVDAYTQRGLNTINSTYTPFIKNLENNVAARFGNLDNSIFLDNLNNIESNRAEAMTAFAQDVEAKRSELVDGELENRYNYLSFLSDYQNQVFDNLLSASNYSLSALSENNSYQNNLNNYLNKTTSKSAASTLNGLSTVANYLGKASNITKFL